MPIRKFLHVALIIALGLFQGLAIVIVPAASTLLTKADYQGLSNQEYGALFLPEIIGAVLLSVMGGVYAKKKGIQPLLYTGLVTNLLGAFLLSSSSLLYHEHKLDYTLLLLSLLMLGAGFGATLTSLNTMMARLFPDKTATAITSLHASLGVGTALSPLLLDLALKLNHWWIAPIVIGVGFLLLLVLFRLSKPVNIHVHQKAKKTEKKLPATLWLFIISMFLYGFCETVIGNWSPIYLKSVKHLSIANANIALSAFWACVTIGRIVLSVISQWVSFRIFYLGLPIFLILIFFLIPPIEGTWENIAIFSLAGLACSALFPLNVSFGEQSFPTIQIIVSGSLMASYMLGYGLASFGVGLLEQFRLIPLYWIFYLGAILAIIMAVFSWINHLVFPNKTT